MSDGVIRLALRVPLLSAAGDELALERDVIASLEPLPKGANEALQGTRIQWKPNGRSFPAFEGTLVAEHDEQYSSFILTLSGSYVPPFGVAGAAFDAVLGNRFAEATAHQLLRDIAESIEKDYRACEAFKSKEREIEAAKTLATQSGSRAG